MAEHWGIPDFHQIVWLSLPKVWARSKGGRRWNQSQIAPRGCPKSTKIAQSWPKWPKMAKNWNVTLWLKKMQNQWKSCCEALFFNFLASTEVFSGVRVGGWMGYPMGGWKGGQIGQKSGYVQNGWKKWWKWKKMILSSEVRPTWWFLPKNQN